MHAKNKISLTRKTLYGIMLLAVFISIPATDKLPSVHAQTNMKGAPLQISGHVLSNGQFVYGPNIGDFIIKTYLEDNAPHLLEYADELYGRSEYYSINPKIYLTLLEIHSHLISSPNTALLEDSFGLNNGDFISQVEVLSDKMSEAYYLHLYSYSPLSVSERTLPSFVTPGGVTINVARDTNAGTYAIIAGLAAMDEQNISSILDNSQINGFYQTYLRLFGDNDPLDEKNNISIPAQAGALAAPDNLLQLPYLQGLSWRFGGVHNTSGTTTFTDASSLDFYPWPISWGADTSNMWVVAAASGIPTRYSDCGYKISHSGAVNIGWETSYYHLEGAKYLSGIVNQNEKIGVIANTLAEATCTGGAASGPHVHFSLKYNGAYVAINGTPLSGWYVHSGRYSYDVDQNYMWLEKGGVKKYANITTLLSEAALLTISGNGGMAGVTLTYTNGTPQFVVTDGSGNYSMTVPVGWSGTVTLYKSGYTFTPVNRTYGNVLSNQTSQDYTAQVCAACTDADSTGVFRPSNGLLYLKNLNIIGYADVAINYGIGGDYPVVGDWDGDGDATIGIYRNGTFYLRNSNTIGYADFSFSFAEPGDQPIAGDWDGDGIDTIGVYRGNTFYLRNSNTAGAPEMTFSLGIPGDVGIAGDWDGDGSDTTGVFRPSSGVIFLKNTNVTGYADVALNYGIPGDKPVTGDWNNDGVDTIGVYRGNIFYLRNSNTVGYADLSFALGIPGDMPIAGNWDGAP